MKFRISFLLFAFAMLSLSSLSKLTVAQADDSLIAAKITSTGIALRNLGLTDPLSIPTSFAANPDDVTVFHVPNVDRDTQQLFWSTFFLNSQMHLSYAYSEKPITSYYNPLIEAFLVVQWDNRGPLPTLTGATLYWSESAPLSEEPTWVSKISNSSIVTVLPDSTTEILKGYEEEFPFADAKIVDRLHGADGIEARQRFGRRLHFVVAGLAELFSDQTLLVEYEDAITALNMGDRAYFDVIEDMAARQIAKRSIDIPDQYRSNLVPSFVIGDGKKALVLASASNNGRYYFLIVMEQGKGSSKLLAVTAFDVLAGGE